MKRIAVYFSKTCAILLVGIVFFAVPLFIVHTQETFFFDMNMRRGDRGPQIFLLQQLLNEDIVTQVAFLGAGSPGNETEYFGQLTEKAVVRFQEKYRAEILSPLGLLGGTGFVGPSTRAKLNALSADRGDIQDNASRDTSAQSVTVVGEGITQSEAKTRNERNANAFISTLRSVINRGGGLTDDLGGKLETFLIDGEERNALEIIEEQIRLDSATTTDFRIDQPIYENLPVGDVSGLGAGALQLAEPVVTLLAGFTPAGEAPLAQFIPSPPTVGFGGPLIYSLYCTCSGTFLLLVGPPNPALVDYEIGTQAFSYYNIPYTETVIGNYFPGFYGICEFYYGYGCVPIPSMGFVTAMVGSTTF